MTKHTNYFTVAQTHVKTRAYDFSNAACTFAARLFGNSYLKSAQERANLRSKQLK